MTMTAAERQQKRRDKLKADPVRLALEKSQRQKRHLARKANGATKLVATISASELLHQRRKWRDYKAAQEPVRATTSRTPVGSTKKEGGRNARRRHTRMLHRTIDGLKGDLKREKRRAQMYRKRWSRCSLPKKKIERRIKDVRIAFQDIVMANIRRRYREAVCPRQKHLRSLVRQLLARYRLCGLSKRMLRISPRRVKAVSSSTGKKSSLSHTKSLTRRSLVRQFFLSDDASRMLSGKKDTITRKKVKQQKRLMSDTLKNLHTRFSDSHDATSAVSYPQFCKERPFWVVSPTQRDRETCLFLTHENMTQMLDALAHLDAISKNRPSKMLQMVACDVAAKRCMYGECTECGGASIQISCNVDTSSPATWQVWKSVKEQREVGGANVQVTVMKQVTESGAIDDLVDAVNRLMPKFKRHHFNMVHQQQFYSTLRKDLAAGECMVHVDYAENYLGKSAREVQAAHFGASHRQITLHTGVYFVGTTVERTFCTLSENTHHGPAAVWCHLRPILGVIRTDHPTVKKIHFFSDGPTSQYKQKGNFLLFANIALKFGFSSGKIIIIIAIIKM